MEILLFSWIKKIKISKWILTNESLNYFFDKNRFNKFKNTNYDVILGWDKKKNTSSFDIIEKKKNKLQNYFEWV